MDIETHPQPQPGRPLILSRSEHGISRKRIDPDTIKVLYRLHRNGHKAYLVGGSVRDLLLQRRPKDFDVGTSATPNQVRKLFRNCFLVGRRFRLAHIRFGPDNLVEVATFRRQPKPEELPSDPDEQAIYSENVFGTPEEDAFRRDFTINALFYNIADFSVIDYTGGLGDLQAGIIRVIGKPEVRFLEDPVRMLRALEFAARLDFRLADGLGEAIEQRAPQIAMASPARMREEMMELFRHKVAAKVLQQAQEFGLLAQMIPGYSLDDETLLVLEKIDERTAAGTAITEPFVLAGLYLSGFRHRAAELEHAGVADMIHLANEQLEPHCRHFQIAHGIRHQVRELLLGFFRMRRGRGRRGERRFLRHPSTPAALELFRLWSTATGQDAGLVEDWSAAVAEADTPQPPPKKQQPRRSGRPRRRRRPSGRRPGKS